MFPTIRSKVQSLRNDPAKVATTSLVVTLAGLATRRAAGGAWRALNGEAPPRDPSRDNVNWSKALTWTTTIGVTVGLARLVARRALQSPARFERG